MGPSFFSVVFGQSSWLLSKILSLFCRERNGELEKGDLVPGITGRKRKAVLIILPNTRTVSEFPKERLIPTAARHEAYRDLHLGRARGQRSKNNLPVLCRKTFFSFLSPPGESLTSSGWQPEAFRLTLLKASTKLPLIPNPTVLHLQWNPRPRPCGDSHLLSWLLYFPGSLASLVPAFLFSYGTL